MLCFTSTDFQRLLDSYSNNLFNTFMNETPIERVICIDATHASGENGLVEGQIYEVMANLDAYLVYINGIWRNGWNQWRFAPVANKGALRRTIFTKILPCSLNKPFRIKAYDHEGNNFILSTTNLPWTLNDERSHRLAAEKLKQKMDWNGTLAGGWTKDGFVFVFVN